MLFIKSIAGRHSNRRYTVKYWRAHVVDYIAYLLAQQKTAASAREARPDSPMQPPDGCPHLARLQARLRRSAGSALRDLADRLEPAAKPARLVCEECN